MRSTRVRVVGIHHLALVAGSLERTLLSLFEGSDLRTVARFADRDHGTVALEGAEPQSGAWPATERSTAE